MIQTLKSNLNWSESSEIQTYRRPWVTAVGGVAARHSFVICPAIGLVLALFLTNLFISHLALSPYCEFICAIAALAGLFGTALIFKILTGTDGFVFYRDAITALLFVALILRLMRQPVLPYMNITILGAGLFQAFGRVGCLLVGCCHGRPSRFGLRYTHVHGKSGFPSYLIGVRLFPIQAVEALCVLAIVFAGSARLLSAPAPQYGSVTAFYALAYGFARFFIEFFRGDVARPVYSGFSQAQWISLILSISVLSAERFGVLPAARWHALVPFTIASVMLLVKMHRSISKSGIFELNRPQHIRELAEFLAPHSTVPNFPPSPFAAPSAGVSFFTTNAGLRLSSAELSILDRRVLAVTCSRPAKPLIPREAHCIAGILSRLIPGTPAYELLPASPGIFHVLINKEDWK